MKNKYLLIAWFALLASNSFSQKVESSLWQTNGDVNAIAVDSNNIYIGGSFSDVMPRTPYGALLDTGNNTVNVFYPKPNDVVNDVISDGNGGWFIGGAFTKVGCYPRSKIAHIDSSGNVSNFGKGLQLTGNVNALYKHGNTLYFGGNFSNTIIQTGGGAIVDTIEGISFPNLPFINGAVLTSIPDGKGGWYIGGKFTQVGNNNRNYLAQINSDGSVSAWNPNANTWVWAIVYDSLSKKIFVGGDFLNIGGVNKNKVAAVDPITGQVSSWNPGIINNSVFSIAVKDTIVYIGGGFSLAGGATRNNLAALSSKTGLATSWNPNPNSVIYTINVKDSLLYVGGAFSTIANASRVGIAAISPINGLSKLWNPNSDGQIRAIAFKDTLVYLAGNFTKLGGKNLTRLGSVSITSGLATNWYPGQADDEIYSIAICDSLIYIGGAFKIIGGKPRNYFASINIYTGIKTIWNPNANKPFGRTISIWKNKIFVGGDFITVGVLTRNNLASIDIPTSKFTSWVPAPSDEVFALLSYKNRLYVGGSFSVIAGQPIGGIASFDLFSGALNGWNPAPNGPVNVIAFKDSLAYIGGSFTSIGGQSRSFIAAVDTTIGKATTWNPDPQGGGATNPSVNAIAVYDTLVYFGGRFTLVGGLTRYNLASVGFKSGKLTNWVPIAPIMKKLKPYGSNIYGVGLGGTVIVGVEQRNYAFAIDGKTGELVNWSPEPNGYVYCIAFNKSKAYIGGAFKIIKGSYVSKSNLASLNKTTGIVTSWNPIINGVINSVIVKDSLMYICGSFSQVNGQIRNNFASFNLNNYSLTNWTPQTNNPVLSMILKDSILFACGPFSIVNGIQRIGVVAVNAWSGIVTSWDAQIGDSLGFGVHTIDIDNSTVYIGGDFLLDGVRKCLAAVDIKTGGSKNWGPLMPSFNVNEILAIHIKDSTVYIGGNFTGIGGKPFKNFAALDAKGNLINKDFQVNSFVQYINSDNSRLYIAGQFNSVLGSPRTAIASLDLKTRTLNEWNPIPFTGDVTKNINSVVSDKGSMYLGGHFYSISGQDAYGFAGFQSRIPSTKGLPTAICKNDSSVIYAPISIGATYQWLKNGQALNGETNSTLVAKQVGKYSVIINDGSGCVNDTSISINISLDSTCVITNANKSNLNSLPSHIVYPNPFDEKTKILIHDANSKKVYSLIIYDILGKEWKVMQNQTNEIIIERNNLPSGVYFYRISSEKSIIGTGKLLIE